MIKEILNKPYAKILTPDGDGYLSEVLEFYNCFSYGKTPEEALENLNDAAEAWLEATIEKGKKVPEPVASYEMSGKYPLRMPKNLHQAAAILADLDGVSLNTFIVTAVAQRVGAQSFINEVFTKLASTVTHLTTGAVTRLTMSTMAHLTIKFESKGGAMTHPSEPFVLLHALDQQHEVLSEVDHG